MTRYLLDTNTVSYLARNSSPAAFAEFARRGGDPNSELCISSITLAEIRYGLAKKLLSPRRIDAMDSLVAFLKVLPWAEREAAAYGILRTRLEAKGITVEAMDMLIAAQAIASGSVLVTHDAIFQRISDLHATVDWATDLS